MPARALPFALSIVALAFMPGCATLFTGSNQSISVETRSEGVPVTGVPCKLQNSRGSWFVTTPASVVIDRSYSDLAITCTHQGHTPASVVVKSSIGAMMFGNIIMIGGIIGAVIDTDTGAAFDYPELITVDFGAGRPSQ